MEIRLFTEMLSDKAADNLKKLRYKYPDSFDEYVSTLRSLFLKDLPLRDFRGTEIAYMPSEAGTHPEAVRTLLRPQAHPYGAKAVEDEISASASIEGIDFDRDSIRRILGGYAPRDDAEERILGQKKGFEFISDISNRITEESIHKLYMLMAGEHLPEDDRLLPGNRYRHDSVHIVGEKIEHTGIDHRKLPERMGELIGFIHREDGLDDMVKAAVIHFYIAYLHPYFDGNGRMARMIHLWYLVQRGFPSALFVPFSNSILKTRSGYYNAFTRIEENAGLLGVLDVTPFIRYFRQNIYSGFSHGMPGRRTLALYQEALKDHAVTPKEAGLWTFILSAYGMNEFSTKELEHDYGNAAYATIRTFVLKFTKLDLLTAVSYGTRTRYRVNSD